MRTPIVEVGLDDLRGGLRGFMKEKWTYNPDTAVCQHGVDREKGLLRGVYVHVLPALPGNADALLEPSTKLCIDVNA